MTTKKQIKDLLKPIMASNPDIVISGTPIGQLFFLTPIRHMICGMYFQPSRVAVYCYPTIFYTETCANMYLPAITSCNRIQFPGYAALRWDRPDFIGLLQARLETEIIPKLRELSALPAYVRHQYNTIENKHLQPFRFLTSLPAIIASGDLDFATLIYREVFEHMDWQKVESYPIYRGEIEWHRGFKVLFEPLLNRDIPKLVTILRDFERESITKSGYEKYWENAPFPLEEQL